MKNRILLNSDLDGQIVWYFIAIISSILVLNWIYKTLKSLDGPTETIGLYLEEELVAENYTLNFNNDIHQVKKLSVVSKTVLVSLSVLIIMTPLYEFIETLRPTEYVYQWSCFPF